MILSRLIGVAGVVYKIEQRRSALDLSKIDFAESASDLDQRGPVAVVFVVCVPHGGECRTKSSARSHSKKSGRGSVGLRDMRHDANIR